jgi:hypothetical protein
MILMALHSVKHFVPTWIVPNPIASDHIATLRRTHAASQKAARDGDWAEASPIFQSRDSVDSKSINRAEMA